MVESGACPSCSRVAGAAGGWELRSNVVRIRGAGVIRLVARVTVCRSPGVDAVYVTTCASDTDVSSSQWEHGLAVIKARRLPCGSGVADLTVRRKLRRDVIGICCAVVVLHVTRRAGGAETSEVAIYVTGGTSHARVCAG